MIAEDKDIGHTEKHKIVTLELGEYNTAHLFCDDQIVKICQGLLKFCLL